MRRCCVEGNGIPFDHGKRGVLVFMSRGCVVSYGIVANATSLTTDAMGDMIFKALDKHYAHSVDT